MADIWGTYFDRVHCDAMTKVDKPCRMVPLFIARDTGKRLCYVHALPEYRRHQGIAPTTLK